MIKRSSKYTVSTEQDLNGDQATSQLNNDSEHNPGLHKMEDYSLDVTQEELRIAQNQKANSWLKSPLNSNYHPFIAKTIQTSNFPAKSFDSDPPKVLVVDDHSASRVTAVALLSLEGYTVIEADNGYTAVEIVKQQQPDLILLDVMMPGIDGFEVCRLIKQDEDTRLIPVIL